MAVDGDGHVLDAIDVLHQVLDAIAIFPRHVEARGVGDVDHGGARLDGRLDHLGQILVGGAAGVFGIELDVVDVLARVLDRMHAAIDCLVQGHALELVLEVLRGDADARVDAGTCGNLQRVGAHVDVALDRACQAADDRLVADDLGNVLHRLEVTRRGDGKARFDDVDAEAQELSGDHELFLCVHARTRGLLPIAERRVENVNLARHGSS